MSFGEMAEMTILCSILPITKRRIVFLLFDGCELLDMAGPAAVFSAVNDLAPTPQYEIVVLSAGAAQVAASNRVTVLARAASGFSPRRADTVLVMGALEKTIRSAMRDEVLLAAIRRLCTNAERYGSVCTGAFLLAAAGLLFNRRATTHWAGCARLAAAFPQTQIAPNALYVVDEKLWTSAGVTAGIDMALEMVRRDLGTSQMTRVAKQLVVYAHRPGNQSQFSALLEAQGNHSQPFADLMSWLDNRIAQQTSVMQMARYVSLSERTFYRQFTSAFGTTPSKYLERLRMHRGKQHLEAKVPVKRVASLVGFRSESAFRSSFSACFGVTATTYQKMHVAHRQSTPPSLVYTPR